jgi:hypothetical protein
MWVNVGIVGKFWEKVVKMCANWVKLGEMVIKSRQMQEAWKARKAWQVGNCGDWWEIGGKSGESGERGGKMVKCVLNKAFAGYKLRTRSKSACMWALGLCVGGVGCVGCVGSVGCGAGVRGFRTSSSLGSGMIVLGCSCGTDARASCPALSRPAQTCPAAFFSAFPKSRTSSLLSHSTSVLAAERLVLRLSAVSARIAYNLWSISARKY